MRDCIVDSFSPPRCAVCEKKKKTHKKKIIHENCRSVDVTGGNDVKVGGFDIAASREDSRPKGRLVAIPLPPTGGAVADLGNLKSVLSLFSLINSFNEKNSAPN